MSTLVHVGWPKTATTWLQNQVFVERLGYRQLFSREEIIRWFVLPDQISFDVPNVRDMVRRRVDDAREEGLVPVISHERLCGVLKNRLESVVIGQRLASTVDDLRILVVVREQRDAMVASWQQYIRNGGSPATGASTKTVQRYFGDATAQASTMPPPGELHYFEYDRLVGWYRQQCGSERVLVLPIEGLRADPVGFHESIRQYADAPSLAAPDKAANNQAWAPITYSLRRRLNFLTHRDSGRSRRYQAALAAVYKFDQALPRGLRRVRHNRTRHLVDGIAAGAFIQSNRRLQSMVEWDVARFGYEV